ncbi:MAG TPA: amidase [Methylomirabilota bacterium]|nr:amidase [Methylomirabilota bacterium]
MTSAGGMDRRAFLGAAVAGGALWLAGGAARAVAAVPADELAQLSAAELANRLRTRQLSVKELVGVHLDRIGRYDGRDGLNAFITVDREGALKEAERLDGLLKQGRLLGPLHGLPLAVKDNLDTAGLRTTGGSKILEQWVPKEDASVVKRLRAAGCVILGKTNMHEFAFGITTNNPHWGPTRNPYDRTRIPGGSSGGSGAAVAAGLCAAAVGTDTGGSVRIPAALCGGVGLKPTLGRVGRGGMMYLSFTRDVVGPMTRTVEDAGLLLRAMAGPDPRDMDAEGGVVPSYGRGLLKGLRGVRIGVPRRYFYEGNHPEVDRLTEQALKDMQGLGATLVDVEVKNLDIALPTGFAIVLPEAIYAMEAYLRQMDPAATIDKYLPQFGPDVQAILGGQKGTAETKPVTGYAYLEALHANRPKVQAGFREALAQVDALVTPTTPLPAAKIGEDAETELLGKKVNTFFTFIKDCDPVSVAGYPALSVPAGFTADGLPVGIQIIGRPWEEARILKIGYAYEQATGRRKPPAL